MISKIVASDNLLIDLKKGVTPFGDIKAFIKPGERVFIKPNFNTSDPFPASTDMEFIKAVISLINTEKPGEIILGDSPTFFGNSRKYFNEKNPWLLEKEFINLRVIYLNDEKWVKKTIIKGKFLKQASLSRIINEVDKVIYLPCLKTHSWAQYTGALKLSVGILKPIERIALHGHHLQEKVAELNCLIKPDLIIMDARKCFITKGPTVGEVRAPGLILVSPNRVEVDIAGINIIKSFAGNDLEDVDPLTMPQIKRAIELGIR